MYGKCVVDVVVSSIAVVLDDGGFDFYLWAFHGSFVIRPFDRVFEWFLELQ